jgi:hypothetical protein
MLKQMDRPTGASADKLRVLRAVEAIERAGATDALKRLAKTNGLAAERARAALARVTP